LLAAEFRGPGVHHNYEDSDSGFEMDAEKGKSFGVDDTEMFENADEDKDLESQVSKKNVASADDKTDESDKTSTTKDESTAKETKE
jgi:protein phosphatase 2C family protein 2/3